MADFSTIAASTVNSRLATRATKSTIDESTVDAYSRKLRLMFNDESLGSRMVAKALLKLGEAEVNSIAEYVMRKADVSPGRAFVVICNNAINNRGL